MSKIIITLKKYIYKFRYFQQEEKSLSKSLLSEGRYFWNLLTPVKFYRYFRRATTSGGRYFRKFRVSRQSKAVHFADMFDPNLILFYLCFVTVPEIAWSARVNTTASDGKVIISGDYNEVIVSTDGANKIALAKTKSSLESVKKSNAELFSRIQAISQRLSVLESQGTNFWSL